LRQEEGLGSLLLEGTEISGIAPAVGAGGGHGLVGRITSGLGAFFSKNAVWQIREVGGELAGERGEVVGVASGA
jgi:hypothetical protein